MSRLLNEELREALPKLSEQDGVKDPIVHAAFVFAASGWVWLVTEGETRDNGEFLFFGYVMGFESEWGYFALSELEEVNVRGLRVERDLTFEPKPFSKCLI